MCVGIIILGDCTKFLEALNVTALKGNPKYVFLRVKQKRNPH